MFVPPLTPDGRAPYCFNLQLSSVFHAGELCMLFHHHFGLTTYNANTTPVFRLASIAFTSVRSRRLFARTNKLLVPLRGDIPGLCSLVRLRCHTITPQLPHVFATISALFPRSVQWQTLICSSQNFPSRHFYCVKICTVTGVESAARPFSSNPTYVASLFIRV